MHHDAAASIDAETRQLLRRTPAAAAKPAPGVAAPAIRAIGRALPPHRYASETLSAALFDAWEVPEEQRRRFERLHRSIGVRHRHLALPVDGYRALGSSFARANDAWLEAATALGAEAVHTAVRDAGLGPRDVDHLFFTTVTGIAVPTVDVRLVNRLGMRPDTKRTPLFGLGCLGGAAGLARAADYLRAFPDEVAVLLSVELCSLTLQLGDRSTANVIAAGLFGDGAAAVVVGGGARRDATGPRVVASRSIFFPDTEEIMGWRITDTGFQVVLAAGIPALVRGHLRHDVEAFLASQGLVSGDVDHWIAHTGGPKVLQAMETALALPPRALARSWASLADVGNLSSASVLFVAGDLLASGTAQPGDVGLVLAMGPGFCGELVLLRW